MYSTGVSRWKASRNRKQTLPAEPSTPPCPSRSRSPKARKPTALPLPPARTQPYEAPYFFPSPGSPEAVDYVRRAREGQLSPRSPPPTVMVSLPEEEKEVSARGGSAPPAKSKFAG